MRNIHSNLTGIEDEELKKLVKKERFQRLIKKVFSIPFLTMMGIWIIVYYQVTSHYHPQTNGFWDDRLGNYFHWETWKIQMQRK